MGSDLKIFDKASRNNTAPHEVYVKIYKSGTQSSFNHCCCTRGQYIYFTEQQKSINLLEHKFVAHVVLCLKFSLVFNGLFALIVR